MFGHDTKYLGHSPGVSCLSVAFSLLLPFLISCSTPSPSSSSDQARKTNDSTSNQSDNLSQNTRAPGFKSGPEKIKEKRTFELTDTYTIGPGIKNKKKLRLWLEVPQETKLQDVKSISVQSPYEWKKTKEPVLGNEFIYVEIDRPEKDTIKIVVNSTVTRRSQEGYYRDEITSRQKQHFLQSTPEIPVGGKMKNLSRKKGAEQPNRKSLRSIYDFVVENSTYYKANPEKFSSSGSGNAEYCLYQQQGGCTDFHALYMSMGRSIGIPTRFVIGSFLPEEFDGKDRDVAYHCWAEALVAGKGWWPLDAAYGDLWPSHRDYYFGNLDARRVTFSRGRFVQLVPEPDARKTISYFIQGYVEADGKTFDEWSRKLTYREIETDGQ